MDQQKLMDDDQARRIIALSVARPLLMSKPNAFAGSKGPEPEALIALADWILTGQQDPLYPYARSDGTVLLGPDVVMRPDGFVEAHGNLYEPSSDDGHEEDQ